MPSPTYFLPLPEGVRGNKGILPIISSPSLWEGGGVRRGWVFCPIPLKGIGQPRTL